MGVCRRTGVGEGKYVRECVIGDERYILRGIC